MTKVIRPVSQEPLASEIQIALDAILSSDAFRRSKRARSLLEYLVKETQAGRGDQLKAFNIAVDVFGRDASFDSESNALVRVQAGKLRERLELYYLSEGKENTLEIHVPKGSYVATFSEKPNTTSPQTSNAPAVVQSLLLHRFFLPFIGVVIAIITAVYFTLPSSPSKPVAENQAPQSGNNVMAQIAFEVQSSGERGKDLSAFIKQRADKTVKRYGQLYVAKSGVEGLVTSGKQPAYLARITTLVGDQEIDANLQVVDFANGTIIASSDVTLSYEDKTPDFKPLEIEIAKTFSQIGPVFLHLQERRDLSDDLRCVLDAMSARRNDVYYEQEIERLIVCLHEALERHPSLGIAGVQLAVLLINEGDRKHLYKGKSAYAEARNVLDEILKVTPNLPGALMVMAGVTFIEGDVKTALEFSNRVVAINPNSPLIRGQQGILLINAGRFAEGQAAIQKAIDLTKQPRMLHRVYLYLAMQETGTKQDNEQLTNILATQNSEFFGIAAYLANIQIGKEDRALRIISELDGGKPADKEFLYETLVKKRFKPEAAQKIVDRVTSTSIWPARTN